jgi:hypothetical protein
MEAAKAWKITEAPVSAIVEAATQGEGDLHRLRDAGLAGVGHAGRVK